MIPRRWRRDEVNKTCYTLVLASTTWNKWIKYSHDPNQQQRWDRKCIEDGIFFHFYWTNISFHTWAHQPKPNQMKVYRFWTTQTHTLTWICFQPELIWLKIRWWQKMSICACVCAALRENLLLSHWKFHRVCGVWFWVCFSSLPIHFVYHTIKSNRKKKNSKIPTLTHRAGERTTKYLIDVWQEALIVKCIPDDTHCMSVNNTHSLTHTVENKKRDQKWAQNGCL